MTLPLLEMRNITKTFPGVIALDQVSFTLNAGEVHVLMGENGAGKSTLMKIINGQYQANCGEIYLEGEPCQFDSPHQSIEAGIAMIHQELNPVLDMTVAENIFLGREEGRFGLLNARQMNKEARSVLSTINLTIDPSTIMRELTVAQMQMVEIAKSISLNARIILMDEPTSAISEREVDALFGLVAHLKESKVGIIYISHKMNEVFRIADRITVLRDGQSIETRAASEFTHDSLIQLMVGREINQIFPPKSEHDLGAEALRVEGLSMEGNFQNISFHVRQGEILGVAGLMGAGRSEVVEAIFGLRKATCGQIFINGNARKIRNPGHAIHSGMALITEDRKKTGLNLKATVREDTSIVTLDHFCILGQIVRTRAEIAAVTEVTGRLRVKTPSLKQLIRNLSGGNQQKVIIARWLMDDPDILILDEPTRGIDVGAKYEIYSIINQMAASGKAIIIVSSEMPELIGICDRCLVMCEGTITGELSGSQLSQDQIMYLAAHQMELCHTQQEGNQ